MSEIKDLSEKPKDSIYELLARNKVAIQSVLPKHLTPERLLRVAYTAIQRSPKLRQCTEKSLVNAILELSVLGLEIGRTGHIVPFGKEAVFIPDYKGYIDLAHRSDRIESFPFKPVYANDEFEYQEGTTRYIRHIPCKTGNRGALVAAYATCFFKHGGFDFEVVWRPDIDATKKVSPGAKTSDSPWNKPDQEWTMWCKTAVRRLAKRIPQSPELQKAAYHEEMAEAGLKQDIDYLDDTIDIPVDFDKTTPEGTDIESLGHFLDLCAQQFNKSVGEVKAEAAKDPTNFWAQFAKWEKSGAKTTQDTPGATKPRKGEPILLEDENLAQTFAGLTKSQSYPEGVPLTTFKRMHVKGIERFIATHGPSIKNFPQEIQAIIRQKYFDVMKKSMDENLMVTGDTASEQPAPQGPFVPCPKGGLNAGDDMMATFCIKDCGMFSRCTVAQDVAMQHGLWGPE